MPRLMIVLLMAVVVLLPMVPAFVLFKYLHSKAKLTGPLEKLNVVLSGAFAGYVVVLIVIIKFLMPIVMPPATPQPCDVWTVTGRVLIDGKATTSLSSVRTNLKPPDLRPASDGTFSWDIGILPGPTDRFGRTELDVMLPGHHAFPVYLLGPEKRLPKDAHDYGFKYGAKVVDLQESINLVSDDAPSNLVSGAVPYNAATAQAPAPVPAQAPAPTDGQEKTQ